MIKISRDAELDFAYDISKSYLEKISLSIKNRSTGEPVRFVYDDKIEKETLDFLLDKLNFDNNTDSIIPGGKYHNRRDYMSFPSMNQNKLTYEKLKPLNIYNFDLSKKIAKNILSDVKCIVHCAAKVHSKEDNSTDNHASFIDLNNQSTIHLLKAAASNGVEHIIFLSTVAVYGKDYFLYPIS